jgi:transposase
LGKDWDRGQESILAERRTVATDQAALADRRARRRATGRSTGYQRHCARAEERLPLGGLSGSLRATHHNLQSLRALGAPRHLGKSVSRACRQRAVDRHTDDRLHTHQGASLSRRRKRGEQKQAVGRSRGGRNTKIHALADAKGRLIALLLTGGEAHDCPVAERLIRRVKPAKRMLGDKAYDSAELREELDDLGTKPVIPNRSNRKQPFSFSKRLYKGRWRIESAFNRLKDFRRIATRYDRLARNYLASVCLAAALVWWI